MQKTRKYVKHKGELEIFTIPNFVSAKECDYLCSIIEANNVRSSVAGSGNVSSTYDAGRTSSTSNLVDTDTIIDAINIRMHNELNIPIGYSEPSQGQLYEVGQEFRHHTDYFEGEAYNNHCLSSGQRTWTFMIYLNDVEEGGETEFFHLGKKRFKPTKGSAVVWKNSDGTSKVYPDSFHAGLPVIKGKKIIITKWFRENPFNSLEDARLAQQIRNSTIEKKSFSTIHDFPRLSPTGFKVIKCPESTWLLIKEAYELLKDKKVEEQFPGKEGIIKGEGNTSDLLSLDHLPTIRSIIHDQLLQTHIDFCGLNIEPTFIYGVRSYNKGAILNPHVDRIATHHISSIVIVDKDLECGCLITKGVENDWPLDIQDHEGKWHKIYAEIGDMILYESAICEHGRIEPFKGNWFRNFYIHYKLSDYIYKE